MKLDECVSDISDAAGAGLVRADENDPNYALIVDFNVLKVRFAKCLTRVRFFIRVIKKLGVTTPINCVRR